MEQRKGVTVPGVTDDESGAEEGEANETMYRVFAARANYLAPGRQDILFAAQEVSRFMSKPEVGDLK